MCFEIALLEALLAASSDHDAGLRGLSLEAYLRIFFASLRETHFCAKGAFAPKQVRVPCGAFAKRFCKPFRNTQM